MPVQCVVLFSDRHGSGNRHRERGRTFYNRRTQQPASESTFSTKAQKPSTRDILQQDIDLDYDGSWHAMPPEMFDRNMSLQNNWHERNGSTSGSRLRTYDCHRQQGKGTSTDVADDDSDPWPPASTESTSVCSNSSFTSDVVPSSPNVGEGWYLLSVFLSI